MPYLKKNPPANEPVDCRILTAALDLFVDHGFHNVSVHDVQKKANVSIGSIYNHFRGKEGIAKSLYSHLLKEFEEMIDEVIDKEQSHRERCNRIIYQLLEYTETRRNVISFMLHAKHREFLPDEPPICSSTPFKAMKNIVQQAMAEGEIRRGEPWVITAAIFGGAIRLIHLRLDGIIKQPVTQFYPELIEAVWQGMSLAEIPNLRDKAG